MRIQIKVFVDAETDLKCSGEKPDFFETTGDFEDATAVLADLHHAVELKRMAEDEDFSRG